MKDFHFNPDVAKEYGVDGAIFLYSLDYWIEHNRANNINFHNGRYWTFNSIKAYEEIFPFWTGRQIRHIVDNLRSRGVIITDEFNAERGNRTLWYTIDYDLLQKCQLDLTIMSNAFDKNDKSIIGEDNKQQINKHTDIENGGAVLFPEMKKSTKENLCLFENSRYIDFDKFAECFTGDEFADVDIYYYYGAVQRWSASGAKKKHDWIATAKNFMVGDRNEGKLHTKKVERHDQYMKTLQKRIESDL